MIRRPATLDRALADIVKRFSGPYSPPSPEFARVRARLCQEARARARALDAASRALRKTLGEPYGTSIHTSNGSHTAVIGPKYRALSATQNGDAETDLVKLIGDLDLAATHHRHVARSFLKSAGRRRDMWSEFVAEEVAAACMAHGLRFKDSPRSEAAKRLRNVFDNLRSASPDGPWAARSEDALRPLLRHARDHQRRLESVKNQVV